MTLAIERSILPPPVVTTAIWPSPTRTRNELEIATPERLLKLNWLVTAASSAHRIRTPRKDQIQRLRAVQSETSENPDVFMKRDSACSQWFSAPGSSTARRPEQRR